MRCSGLARISMLLFGWSAVSVAAANKASKPDKAEPKPAKPPRVHTVFLGTVRRVPFVAADVAAEDKADEGSSVKVRPLVVDTRIRDWTVGEIHEITERSFTVQRVLHVNDTLPGEHTTRWVWQPGPWLLVDRVTGHIAALHLPDFDAAVSDVVWYRDFSAYCGIHSNSKASTINATAWQIGARHAALSHTLGKWPPAERVRPVCTAARWQREPMRVTLGLNGSSNEASAQTFDLIGASTALVEEGDNDEE